MSYQVSIVALNNASGASVMGVIDLFGIANRISHRINETEEPLFKLRIMSVDGTAVRCSNGYSIPADGRLEDIEATDIVYLCAFAIATRQEVNAMLEYTEVLTPWLSQQGPRQATLATSCSGSFPLAQAGLLNGKQATTAWWLSKYFTEHFPKVHFDPDAICSVADNILCGAGTTSYQDVCLAIVERYAGKHFARLTAKYLMIDNQRRSQTPYAILSLIENDDRVVAKAEGWIRNNLARDFRIDEVADFVAVSPRTLIRRFQNSLSETPQSFTQKLRIEKCKTLLETTQLRFGEIVQRCGYNDESAFRRLFKRHCQLSPRDYRRRFNTAVAVE